MIDFQNPINFGGANQTVEVDDGSAATDAKLSGALTNGGLTKTGAGTLWLSASNNYALGININGGQITIPADSALGDVNGPVTFGASATLQAGGNVSMPATRSVTISTGTATFDTQGNQITVAGVVSGSGGLTKLGTSILTLSGSNTYAGKTTVKQGMLRVASEASLGTLPTGFVADQLTLDGGMLQNNNSNVIISANRGITLAPEAACCDRVGANRRASLSTARSAASAH